MRTALLVLAALALSACGGGDSDHAIAACKAAIAEKLANKNYRISEAEMRAGVTEEQADLMHVSAPIVFDPGLPREYTQTFDCRVRFTAGKDEPDVISLNFVW
ncbi:MAG TPA: hypothetical protein VFG21_11545 [Xanthomonadaceae bacterium]|nr:hypothetical protein [Xanthomonadaceae bacterium]